MRQDPEGTSVGRNLMVIAHVPRTIQHVAAMWSSIECLTGGMDKVVVAVPIGRNEAIRGLLAGAQFRIGHDIEIEARHFVNDRYDIGLWCDALVSLGFPSPGSNYSNIILLNDSVFEYGVTVGFSTT